MSAHNPSGDTVLTVLDGMLACAVTDPEFRALLGRLLAGPGRVLDPGGAGKWSAYVTGTAHTLGGEPAAASVAAAAIACIIAAADVVDDLVDDEWHDAAVTAARATNAAVALGALAHCCAAALSPLIGVTRAMAVGDLLARGYLRAAEGEDADLLLEGAPATSEEEAHAMTCRKAGALGALACRVGALVATADPAIGAAVGAFGTHAGITAQILNDLAGAAPGTRGRGSDLRLRKKTLPVAFALRCAREEGIAPLLAWYGDGSDAREAGRGQDEEEIASLIADLGGLEYAGVVADAHRREARAALRRLLRLTGRPAVGVLRHLVPAVRWQSAAAAC